MHLPKCAAVITTIFSFAAASPIVEAREPRHIALNAGASIEKRSNGAGVVALDKRGPRYGHYPPDPVLVPFPLPSPIIASGPVVTAISTGGPLASATVASSGTLVGTSTPSSTVPPFTDPIPGLPGPDVGEPKNLTIPVSGTGVVTPTPSFTSYPLIDPIPVLPGPDVDEPENVTLPGYGTGVVVTPIPSSTATPFADPFPGINGPGVIVSKNVTLPVSGTGVVVAPIPSSTAPPSTLPDPVPGVGGDICFSTEEGRKTTDATSVPANSNEEIPLRTNLINYVKAVFDTFEGDKCPSKALLLPPQIDDEGHTKRSAPLVKRQPQTFDELIKLIISAYNECPEEGYRKRAFRPYNLDAFRSRRYRPYSSE